jgi:trigger factor
VPLIEGCKHSLEVTIPADEVEQEYAKALAQVTSKVRLPGFRPGKVPKDLVKTRFSGEIRQQVLDALLPKALNASADRLDLKIVSRPDIVDLKWEPGEPVHFKAEFEASPDFELGQYNGLTVKYTEPVVTEEQLEARLQEIREAKAEFVNIDPRPAVDGDYALVNLKSVSGAEQPVEREDLSIKLGDPGALQAFNENLAGMTPGEEKEFTVTYPEGYAEEKLAGKTVTFHMKLTALRRKELPELNDEFAKDLGDFQNMDELRNMLKANMLREKEAHARNDAKMLLIDQLVASHDFPVPEVFVDRQLRDTLQNRLAQYVQQGGDPNDLNFEWKSYRESNKEQAVKDVKASLLLEKIADREAIQTMRDEMDKEIQRIARAQKRPVAQVRMDLEKNNRMGQIASQIRTEKVLNHLFDQARKEAPE